MDLNIRALEIYNEFFSFPSHNSIVRLNQRDDAYTILAFEILFNNYHQITKFRREEYINLDILVKSVVAPPDDSIDIFYEETDVDEHHYHIVQVKNQALAPSEIEAAFLLMESTITNYLKKPADVRKNLREVIAATDFSKQYKSFCTYYVVHAGNNNFIRHQKLNQKVVTFEELSILENGTRQV